MSFQTLIYYFISYPRRKLDKNKKWKDYAAIPHDWVNRHYIFQGEEDLRVNICGEKILDFYRKDKHFFAMSTTSLSRYRKVIIFPNFERRIVSPAIFKKGRMSVAVTSDGLHPLRSVTLRNKIKDLLRSSK